MLPKVLFIVTPLTEFEPEKTSLSGKTLEVLSPPLGLCYLGGMLRKMGYGVELYDPHIENFDKYSKEDMSQALKAAIKNKIRTSDHTILGISSPYLYTYKWAHYISKISKAVAPEKKVIMGGGYPSLVPEKVMEDINVDYVVIGEGEIVLTNLVEKIAVGSDVGDLDGVAYKSDGNIVVVPKKTFVEDVNSISYPAWDLVDVERYFLVQSKRKLNVISSRACPYSCTFCNSYKTWGKGFRKRSAQDILGEVAYLVREFGVKEIGFVDDNMTIDKNRFMEIAGGLKEIGVTWNINNISSFTTDSEMLMAMKEGGCGTIAIALESANERTLKSLRKPVDLVKTIDLLKECRRIGLRCNILIISGLPYETKAEMRRTFDYVEAAGADWCTISMLVPFPGTDVYEYCMEHDYFIDKDLDYSKFTLRNQGFIETEHWDREWAANATHEANIRINFLKNYNILHEDGDIEYAIKMFDHVFRFHPKHVIACICLAYAYSKKGAIDKSRALINQAQLLLGSDEVQKEYGRFMDWDEEVINFYHSQCQAAEAAWPLYEHKTLKSDCSYMVVQNV